MPGAPLRLALAQFSPTPCEVETNARAAVAIVRDAADRGAHLVVFPELFLTGYELPFLAATPGAWLAIGDARLDAVRRECADRGVTVVLGAAAHAHGGGRVIAAPVIGPHGDMATSFKEHLHGSETALFRAGVPCLPFEVHGWRVAIGICFDASRPSHAEHAARDGADLYVVSALYMKGEERRADLHLGARAMDNRVFTALANYAGTSGGFVSCGLSGAWSPTGDVRERAGTDEGLVLVDLDPAELSRYRQL